MEAWFKNRPLRGGAGRGRHAQRGSGPQSRFIAIGDSPPAAEWPARRTAPTCPAVPRNPAFRHAITPRVSGSEVQTTNLCVWRSDAPPAWKSVFFARKRPFRRSCRIRPPRPWRSDGGLGFSLKNAVSSPAALREQKGRSDLVQNRATVPAGGSVKAGRAAVARMHTGQDGHATRF
jgi:hypothetical protein